MRIMMLQVIYPPQALINNLSCIYASTGKSLLSLTKSFTLMNQNVMHLLK